jgi:pimeloyl-ACP methyl ester carboxylesterase
MRFDSPAVTRRQLLQCVGVLLAHSAVASNLNGTLDRRERAAVAQTPPVGARNENVEYGKETLPAGIRSRYIDNNNGSKMHVLEAGFAEKGRPCVVFLHGFPELGYTWRKQLLPIASAGFHAIAPDLRGYGRSTAGAVAFEDDLLPYTLLNRVADVVGLVRALGYEKVAAVVGHDWGGPTAAWCALLRPDIFQSVVLMSTPFGGPEGLPFDTVDHPPTPGAEVDIDKDLASLPRPRKHYRHYFATRGANEEMWHPPQGMHDFLRAWFYFKSADWKGNKPFPLKSWTATELAKMPEYYIMDLNKTTAETMADRMPSKAQIAGCRWMTENDIEVYSTEYIRTGFQGGLNSYRVLLDSRYYQDLRSFSGRTIDVPSCYIAGASDWGAYQSPGSFEAMQHGACTQLLGVHFVNGAGHSLAEEQPEQVNRLLFDFLRQAQQLRKA